MSDASDQHCHRGFDLYDQGKLVEAIAEWREASRLDPEDDYPFNSIGVALLQLGRQQEALQVLRTATKLCPNSVRLLSSIGCLVIKLACEDSNKVLVLEAHQALQKAVALEPQNAYALHLLGLVEWQLGRKREAIQLLKASVEVDPNDSAVHLNLRQYQALRGDWRGMLQSIKAIDSLPIDDDIMQYYDSINRSWDRLMLFTVFLTGFAIIFFWLRKRRA